MNLPDGTLNDSAYTEETPEEHAAALTIGSIFDRYADRLRQTGIPADERLYPILREAIEETYSTAFHTGRQHEYENPAEWEG